MINLNERNDKQEKYIDRYQARIILRQKFKHFQNFRNITRIIINVEIHRAVLARLESDIPNIVLSTNFSAIQAIIVSLHLKTNYF